MQRYLFRLSYDGTNFLGAQKLQTRVGRARQSLQYQWEERKTVQGSIEQVLYGLFPKKEPIVTMMSRTDSGVHAWGATAIVHLSPTFRSKRNSYTRIGDYFCPKYITTCLNQDFKLAKLPIREGSVLNGVSMHCYISNQRYNLIEKTLAIRGDLAVRTLVQSRKYIYSFINVKSPSKSSSSLPPDFNLLPRRVRVRLIRKMRLDCPASFLPAHITDRHAEFSGLDMEKIKEALDRFRGVHNFGAFCKVPGYNEIMSKSEEKALDLNESLTRNIEDISLHQISVDPFLLEHYPTYKNCDFYSITVKSSGFLHSQVRRMVGAAFAVGEGKVGLDSIDRLFEVPQPCAWGASHIKAAPACGLTLADSVIRPEVLKGATDDVTQLPVLPLAETFRSLDAFGDIEWAKCLGRGLSLDPKKATPMLIQAEVGHELKKLSKCHDDSQQG